MTLDHNMEHLYDKRSIEEGRLERNLWLDVNTQARSDKILEKAQCLGQDGSNQVEGKCEMMVHIIKKIVIGVFVM